MATTLTAFLFLFLASAQAEFFNFNPIWENLGVTWGINIFQSSLFSRMPLTETEATNKAFEKLNPHSSCIGKFLGTRYMKPDDRSVIIIYDNNGYLAGIQTSLLKSEVPGEALEFFQNQSMFIEEEINGKSSYVLTAYLVNPGIICTGGRTKENFEAQKGGTGLFIQNGKRPQIDYFEVPMNETVVTKTKLWKRGYRFKTMGMHYWYNVSKDMDCNKFLPMFLLYNRQKLTGFGWVVPGDFTSSHYEHPTKRVIKKFMNPVPKCLYDWYDTVGKFSTMHIYMNGKPWNLMSRNNELYILKKLSFTPAPEFFSSFNYIALLLNLGF